MLWSEWIKEPVCWLVCYLIIANLAGFAMMGIDKYKAKHERWRIRERTLMLTAALGGSVGVFCGQRGGAAGDAGLPPQDAAQSVPLGRAGHYGGTGGAGRVSYLVPVKEIKEAEKPPHCCGGFSVLVTIV